jgi:hypothetical protein
MNFGFQPDTTTARKSTRTIKAPRARIQRGKNYDPSLTADMRPPDIQMRVAPPTLNTQAQRPMTEEEKSARERSTKDLAFKLAYLKTRSSEGDTIMRRDPEEFAQQWEADIWERSVLNSDEVIRKYEDAILSAIKKLDQFDDTWDQAKMAADGKEWTGALLFAFQMDFLYGKMQPIEHGSQFVGTSTTRLHDPSADAIESMLNADIPHADLTPKQRRRRNNRRTLRERIKDICKLFEPTNQMANLDAVALAASWESRL